MRFCSRSEGAIYSLCWGTSVDDSLGLYQIVWRYRYGWLRRCEEEAQLVGDEVAGKGGASDCFFEDEAIVDRCDGEGGGAHVDDQGCGFARGEAVTC